ncbi:hypothetical protein D3C83_335170 [compost metagenome]
MLHVEPDHQCAGVVVGAGTDRGADARILEKAEQQDRHDNGGQAGVKLGGVDDQ